MTTKRWCAIAALAGIAAFTAVMVTAAEREEPKKIGEQPIRGDEAKIMAVVNRLTPNIKSILAVPPDDGRFLRIMVEATGAKNVVEIGTSHGYSGLWLCLGLQNTGGKLTTFEFEPERVKAARANFKEAGLEKTVTVVEGDAHKNIKSLKGPIDLVFIDAEKEGYADYIKQLLPLIRPGGLILAHNTISNAGQMQDYLKAITTDPDLTTVFASMSERGIGVTMKKHPVK